MIVGLARVLGGIMKKIMGLVLVLGGIIGGFECERDPGDET